MYIYTYIYVYTYTYIRIYVHIYIYYGIMGFLGQVFGPWALVSLRSLVSHSFPL